MVFIGFNVPPPHTNTITGGGGGRENPINLNQFLLLFLVPFFFVLRVLLFFPTERERKRDSSFFLAVEAFSSPVEYAVGAGGIRQYSAVSLSFDGIFDNVLIQASLPWCLAVEDS